MGPLWAGVSRECGNFLVGTGKLGSPGHGWIYFISKIQGPRFKMVVMSCDDIDMRKRLFRCSHAPSQLSMYVGLCVLCGQTDSFHSPIRSAEIHE